MGLSALNMRIVVVENNFSSLESVDIEGLDEVKTTWLNLRMFKKRVCPPLNSSSTRPSLPFKERWRL